MIIYLPIGWVFQELVWMATHPALPGPSEESVGVAGTDFSCQPTAESPARSALKVWSFYVDRTFVSCTDLSCQPTAQSPARSALKV